MLEVDMIYDVKIVASKANTEKINGRSICTEQERNGRRVRFFQFHQSLKLSANKELGDGLKA